MKLGAVTWAALVRVVEAAYPREGCGWLVGDVVRAAAVGTERSFGFADRDLIALARGAPPTALFHAHPDGAVTLSARDVAALAPGGVALYPVPHLVIAVAGGRAHAAALWHVGPAPRCLATYQRGAPPADRWTAAVAP